MRGFGLRIWLIFQSIAQAQACFGENAQTVLDNLGTQLYFSISSYETARTLSERIGDATILIKTVNETFGQSHQIGGGPNQPASRSYSLSTTAAPHGRKVLQPNEILNLPDLLGLLFHKNMHVIPIKLARYYNAPEFAEWRPGSGIRGTGKRVGLGFFTGFRAVAALAMAAFFAMAMAALTQTPAATRQRPASGMGRPSFGTPFDADQGFNDPPLFNPMPSDYYPPPTRTRRRR